MRLGLVPLLSLQLSLLTSRTTSAMSSQRSTSNNRMSKASKSGQGCTLFLFNLSLHTTRGKLDELVAPFGAVKKLHYVKQVKTPVYSRIAAVQFILPSSRDAAFLALQGRKFIDNPLSCRVPHGEPTPVVLMIRGFFFLRSFVSSC